MSYSPRCPRSGKRVQSEIVQRLTAAISVAVTCELEPGDRLRMSAPAIDWTPGRRQSAALHVHLLGLSEQRSVVRLQDELAREIAERSDTFGTLLICEHPFGVSVGREAVAEDLRVDRDDFDRRGIAVNWQSRGGRVWIHHPGQLVAYFVAPITRLKLTAEKWCGCLAAASGDAAKELGVLVEDTTAIPGATGRCGQFAFVGAAIRDGVSLFGGCLNVSVPRDVLQMANWGPDVRPSTISAERMRPTAMSAVREGWVRQLAAHTGYDRFHLWTGHPRLKRTEQPGYVFAET
jgi:lipoyl(octanoyl) transferase